MSGGGAEAALDRSSWEKIKGERFWLLGSQNTAALACGVQEKGQHGWRIAGVENWLGAELTCGGSHRRNSCARGAELEIGGIGDAPDHTAKLLRGLARAKGQRSDVLTAAQRSGTGRGKAGRCARVLGGVKMAGAGAGVGGCQNKGRAGILDVRARWGRLRQSRP